MKDISDLVCLVYDRGTFFPVAQRLAREYKTVYYNKPSGESFKTVATDWMGNGHPDVEFISEDEWWLKKKEIDLFVFPDCRDWGLQVELEAQGFPVWGSKLAGRIESMRGDWNEVCRTFKMPMPHTEEIRGLSEVREFLKTHLGWFIKISEFRGDMETWEAKTPVQVRNKLDFLQMKWGPLAEEILFYVQAPVKTKIESGSDTYNVWGDYPDEVIIGYEKKGESYFAAVRKASEMPEEVWAPMKAIQPLLKRLRYANLVSSEVRIDSRGIPHWLDPCFRTPSPAGEEELEMYENFGEIVAAGAEGTLVQPKWAAKFCGEAVISYVGDRDGWKSIEVPEEVAQWVKLYANAFSDGASHFPPSQDPEAIGCAVAMGDEPGDVLSGLKRISEALKDMPVELHIEPMADLFKEIETAEAKGIPFSDEPVPEPAEVLDES